MGARPTSKQRAHLAQSRRRPPRELAGGPAFGRPGGRAGLDAAAELISSSCSKNLDQSFSKTKKNPPHPPVVLSHFTFHPRLTTRMPISQHEGGIRLSVGAGFSGLAPSN